MSYTAPLRDIMFTLEHIARLDRLRRLGDGDVLASDSIGAILDAAGQLAKEVLAPLQRIGDRIGSRLEKGAVVTPPGWPDAYHRYVDGGWNTLPFAPALGGQGLPWTLAFAVQELWHGANTAFAACPLLNQSAVELLGAHGDAALKAAFLPRMVTGEWTGTMNLTEAQAGSDLGTIRTRARLDGQRWHLTGQKIFVTYGDHDLASNIIQFVLARTEGAPEGTHGLSLFLVPKVLPGTADRPGPGVRNDYRCVSLEKKLGMHGSPTCVISYGDGGGAQGFLIGREGRGLLAMFTMMNMARLGVGVQGIGIAERARQQAVAYARLRIQGRLPGGNGGPVAIIRHPDVRRMLLTMRAQIEAMRALAYSAAAALDLARREPGRRAAQAQADLLTPVVKAWSTDLAVDIASLGIQVHGGMGYIEETGAAQLLRDARATPIYEGTNGIHAHDLVFRKIGRDEGAAAHSHIASLRLIVARLADLPGEEPRSLMEITKPALDVLSDATEWLLEALRYNPLEASAASVPYLRLFATVSAGALLVQGATAAWRLLGNAEQADADFLRTRIAVALFYATAMLPEAAALATSLRASPAATLALPEAEL